MPFTLPVRNATILEKIHRMDDQVREFYIIFIGVSSSIIHHPPLLSSFKALPLLRTVMRYWIWIISLPREKIARIHGDRGSQVRNFVLTAWRVSPIGISRPILGVCYIVFCLLLSQWTIIGP